ncbi:MAG: GGDEF domain-containing protein [Pseudomonadota bacterium]
MSRSLHPIHALSDRITRLPDSASSADRAKSRAMVIWTAIAGPMVVLVNLIAHDMNMFHPAILMLTAGALGAAYSILHLRYTHRLDQSGWIYLAGAVGGMAIAAWLTPEHRILPLISLVATPVFFGLIVSWRQCLNYTIGLTGFYILTAIWVGFTEPGSLTEVLQILAMTLAAYGVGMSTSGYAYSTERVSRMLKKQRDEIEILAYRDALTGIENRRAFNEYAPAESVENLPTTLAVIDLDEFKATNDLYGHDVGDQLLKEFAARLAAIAGETARVFRLGGDEFAMISTDEDLNLDCVGRAICESADTPISTSVGDIAISMSVGLSHSKEGDLKALYREADTAAYAAKRKREPSWVVFEDGMQATRPNQANFAEAI